MVSVLAHTMDAYAGRMATEWDCIRTIEVRPGELLGSFPSLEEARECAERDVHEHALELRGNWQPDGEQRQHRMALGRIGPNLREVRYDVQPRRQS